MLEVDQLKRDKNIVIFNPNQNFRLAINVANILRGSYSNK